MLKFEIKDGDTMRFDQIIVIKETHENEKRVALTPSIVSQLVSKGYRILIERDAGLNAGFSNDEYVNSGAKLFSLTSDGFPPNSFIVRVLRPSKERESIEKELFHENTAMLGFLFPFIAGDHIASWQNLGITILSFDLFKSLSIYDPKNAQAAMSQIAGKLAFHDALKFYKGESPIMLTVIGAGALGISSAKEAIKCNVPVQIFSRSEMYRAELEKIGVKYFILPEHDKQIGFIQLHLIGQTIIIAAARVAGKKAPLLMDEISLSLLPPKAVVVDLAISTGGNVQGSRYDEVVNMDNGISILNISGYPKKEPCSSSEVYAKCVYSLLIEIMSPDGNVDFHNKLVQEIWVTHQKKLRESLYNNFDKNDH
jgi:NAD(P) transhydrogenase subunit alpha